MEDVESLCFLHKRCRNPSVGLAKVALTSSSLKPLWLSWGRGSGGKGSLEAGGPGVWGREREFQLFATAL